MTYLGLTYLTGLKLTLGIGNIVMLCITCAIYMNAYTFLQLWLKSNGNTLQSWNTKGTLFFFLDVLSFTSLFDVEFVWWPGEGEPPDTALKFMKLLKSRVCGADHTNEFSYTILGLGDTNYTNFCNFGKTLDKYLSAVGGKRLGS